MTTKRRRRVVARCPAAEQAGFHLLLPQAVLFYGDEVELVVAYCQYCGERFELDRRQILLYAAKLGINLLDASPEG